MNSRILDRLAEKAIEITLKLKQRSVHSRARSFPGIDPSVQLGPNVLLLAPPHAIAIGKGTYVNEAILSASEDASIQIGERCAIGYRVSIKAVTHDPRAPAPDVAGNVSHASAPITIGDRCWIGDNVFIREGITLGDDVIVGANSVVTKSFPAGAVIGGVPAKALSR